MRFLMSTLLIVVLLTGCKSKIPEELVANPSFLSETPSTSCPEQQKEIIKRSVAHREREIGDLIELIDLLVKDKSIKEELPVCTI